MNPDRKENRGSILPRSIRGLAATCFILLTGCNSPDFTEPNSRSNVRKVEAIPTPESEKIFEGKNFRIKRYSRDIFEVKSVGELNYYYGYRAGINFINGKCKILGFLSFSEPSYMLVLVENGECLKPDETDPI